MVYIFIASFHDDNASWSTPRDGTPHMQLHRVFWPWLQSYAAFFVERKSCKSLQRHSRLISEDAILESLTAVDPCLGLEHSFDFVCVPYHGVRSVMTMNKKC
ncbi:hypothetical protein FKM82_023374 [Ascaphus truei]